MPFGFDVVLDKFSEAGKALLGTFTQEDEDKSERQGSRSSQTAVSSQVRSSQDYVPRRTDRSTMEKNDDDVIYTGSSRINPVPIESSRPPQRTNAYKASSDDREEIKDLFPEPPAPRRPAAPRMTASNSTQASSDRREERKFFGTQAPKNATPITMPGSESPAPVSSGLRKKPGAERRHVPRNTLDQTKSQAASGYQGSARPPGISGTQRAKAATKHPNALSYETSRGENVRNDFDFPDGRSPKRQKTEPSQRTVQKPRLEQVFDSIQEKNAVTTSQAINPQLFRPPPKAAPRSMNWEVSGTQESKRVEETIRRPPREERKTRRHDEVVDISDDESAAPLTATVTAKRGRGRPAKKQKVDDENVIEIEEGDVNQVHERSRARNDHLSPYFGLTGNTTQRQMAPKQAIDPDEVQRNPTGLAAGVHAALSSSQRTHQQKSVVDVVENIEDSEDEAAAVRDAGRFKRRASKDATAKLSQIEVASDDDDELHAGRQTTLKNGRKTERQPVSSTKKARQSGRKGSNDTWPVEEVIDAEGIVHQAHHFLEVAIHIGETTNFVRLREQNADVEKDMVVIDLSRVRSFTTSDQDDNVYLRIHGMGIPEPRWDFKFRDHVNMMDFAHGLENASHMKKNQWNRQSDWMRRIYGAERQQPRRHRDNAIDEGVEENLLKKRTGAQLAQLRAPARTATDGGRPRQSRNLVSQLQASEETRSQYVRASRRNERDLRLTAYDPSGTAEPPQSSANRPVRTTRLTRKIKSPTPEPAFECYSKIHGLGERWAQPVIYPEVGRKRVTVNFDDLVRLDDGEFLNDNLIEFYIRWLQVQHADKVKEKTAYFFGTHFFSTVSDTSSMNKSSLVRNKSINYSAVERWTAKDNLFDYDFVVVPINESAHWYLAIICNLPQVKKKLESQDTQETEEATQEVRLSQEKGSNSHPVNISESVEDIGETQVPDSQSAAVPETAIAPNPADAPTTSAEQDQSNGRASTPTKGATQQIDNLTLASPKSAPAVVSAERAEVADDILQPIEDQLITDPKPVREVTDETIHIRDSQKTASQVSEGILSNAAPPSPEQKKKGKRKSGPGLKRYPSDHLAIVTIDPMGSPHGRAVSTLKDYLIEEAYTKYEMDITKDMFQGMTARKGIPQQSNYYDCGIFVCGYLDKFMQDPYDFGKKLLLQEFEEDEDWPEMQPAKMRHQMREMLQDIAKDQKQGRLAKKAEKRASKLTSPLTGKTPDLCSPVKPNELAGIVEEKVESKPALPPRVARSPSIPTTVQDTQEDEMIMRPEAAAQSQPLTQQMADSAQEPQSSDWKQAVAPGESTQASQESAASTGSEESLDRQVVAGGVKPSLPIKIFEDPPSQGAEATTQDSVIIGYTQETSKIANEKLDRLTDEF